MISLGPTVGVLPLWLMIDADDELLTVIGVDGAELGGADGGGAAAGIMCCTAADAAACAAAAATALFG